ncbi:DUF4328 domain-containing protein [Allokutzneria oryzae]|uniref:DUF4328 domain-containing protein n=1 Tax=Allokutzneria oryzae TaxID=1378989 RepID=A0ABV6A011_9PSEU
MRPGPPMPMARPMAVDWVASPPVPVRPYRQRGQQPRYTGPPSYPAPPRWGLPALPWRWQVSVPGTAPKAGLAERMRILSGTAITLLWVAAFACGLAAVAELWRYVMLLISRSAVLSYGWLKASDALVITAGVLAPITSAVAAVVAVLWLLRARQAAAEATGLAPARPDWQVLVGLLPGPNLSVPGSTLTELEHAALGEPAHRRPRPSKLLTAWWITWVAGLLLAAITLLWGLRSGVQAQADGVALRILTDAVAVAVAVLSIKVIVSITALLSPLEDASLHRMLVVRVDGAPTPQRRTRTPDHRR